MDTPAINASLLNVLRRILRPLARLLLAEGIPLQTAIEMLKQALVDSAEADFTLSNKAQTDSRISLMTGVHRKDVKRLRERETLRKEAPPGISMGARLVSLWLTHPPFVDENEMPVALPRLRSQGGEISFEALAQRISKDIRPRAVLDELVRVGAVSIDAGDRVTLNAEAFIPSASMEERLYYLGRAVGDHLEAASRNVTGTPRPFLERIVHYDAIPESAIDSLRIAAEKAGMQALKSVNRKAMESSQEEGDAPGQRLTFGVYFFNEPAGAEKVDSR
ncbi:MAG: hypothetical protein IPG66_13095 [Hydrogenophilales bacterium]|nr:hypothetical protein [Hydrogenophilales bacterium]